MEAPMKFNRFFVIQMILFFSFGMLSGFVGATGNLLEIGGIPQLGNMGSVKSVARLHQKLDRGLNSIVAADDRDERARMLGYRISEDRVQIVVEASPGYEEELSIWLFEHGAINLVRAYGLIQAHLPFEELLRLSDKPGVLRVRKPHYLDVPDDEPVAPKKLSLYSTTEGLAAMGMNAWHDQGFRGAGIKVGVIDPQMGRWNELLGTDLPPQNRVSFQAFGGLQPVATDIHGTACSEIVYDLAPDLDHLYLAMTGTEVDIAAAVQWMKNNGVTVISMSAGWLSWGPGDGSGYVADIVNDFVNTGGVWTNSAGNSRLAHWQGRFNDSNGDNFLNFDTGWEINYISDGAGNPVEIPAGTSILGSLVWNEWDGVPQTDLDFYLYYWDGVSDPYQVASSEEYQGSTYPYPKEEFVYEAAVAGYYGYAVKRYGGTSNPDIEFFNRFDANPLLFNIGQGSTIPPANALGAIAVAAVDVSPPYTIESYSSMGPANGPGGSLTGGRIKPDISGFANVTTSVYGARAFNGTSSACPHIAGAAAVIWSANPGWSASQVRSYLENQAADMGPGGKDNEYGYGRLQLGNPPVGCTFSISPASQNFSSSGGTGSISVSTQSGCSWTAVESLSWVSITSGSSGSGNGTVQFSVSANTGSNSRSGTISVAGKSFVISQSGTSGGASEIYMVAGIAHASGSGGSVWRSTLAVTNRSGGRADLTLVYRYGSGTSTRSYGLQNGGIVEWADVVSSLFGISAASAGSVEVQSTRPVIVTARTYNEGAAGTFGQFLPGVDDSSVISYGREGILPQIKKTSAFRTNIGFVNSGGSSVTVRTKLYSSSGSQLGSTVTTTIPARQWKQENDVFQRAGVSSCDLGYASVEVTTNGATVWAYASVVDNGTGDPTTIPVSIE